ncbi:caspase-1-like isoform X2 [Linepithema humile]|uniref:caspase-1-like isoform X2 n=1 Tax=Linepithema humile TaxID=83485 RepID=UPI000623353E|nr:PREDICTED: caspase-1-like isoform X2 [Linepithema humile]
MHTKQNKKSPVQNAISKYQYDKSSDEEPKSKLTSIIDSAGFSRLRSKSTSVIPDFYTPSRRNSDKPDTVKPQIEILHKIDAHVITAQNQNINDSVISKPSTSTAYMSVQEDADCYNMSHKNRGKCVIFNHEVFEITNFDNREGTAMDAKRLEKSFTRLGFEVKIHNDFTFNEIMNEIENLSEYDHTDNDCLCIIVLTHGLHQDLISAKDSIYNSDKIWKSFTANKCKTLAGKPKLFFFQACRGEQLDSGVVLSTRVQTRSNSVVLTGTDSVSSYKIPTHADFLLAHSSVQGFYTWRNPEEGTWYVQCLCDVLDKHGTEYELMNLLTMTARKVAINFASYNPNEISLHEKKQVPSVTTMLTRSVYFTPKSNT